MADYGIEDTVDESAASRCAVGVGNLDIFVKTDRKRNGREIEDFGERSHHNHYIHEREALSIPAVTVDESIDLFAV